MDPLFEFQVSQLDRALGDTQAATAAGYLHLSTVQLFQNPLAINQALTVAECNAAVATFSGYAATVLTWNTPTVAADGTVEVLSQAITFQPTDAVTPNIIYGVFITDSAGTHLLFAAQFANGPKPMQNALQVIRMTIRFRPATNSMVASFD